MEQKRDSCLGVPLAKPRVALSAPSPRADHRAVGFPLQSLTRIAGSRVGYFIVALLVSACGTQPTEVSQNNSTPEQVASDGFIPIDFSDTGYADVHIHAHDTVTPDGWAIQYLVKDDSTRYNDLYIRWSKEGRHGLFQCGDVLLMRRYFIPEFVSENANHIFLEHGCATSCSAVLALSKDTVPQGRDIFYVVDQDLSRGQLVYIPERSFSLDTLEVSVVDHTANEEHPVVFKGHCTLAPEDGCIDSVSFGDERVLLYATLLDDNGKQISERHVVKVNSRQK